MSQQRPHAVVWIDIPATDLTRASRFYSTVLGHPLQEPIRIGPHEMAVFPYEKGNISGCVMTGPDMKPATDGTVVYLNADPLLDDVLRRVEPAGGAIVQPRTELPPGMGVYAKIRDTEGNVVGLHALG